MRIAFSSLVTLAAALTAVVAQSPPGPTQGPRVNPDKSVVKPDALKDKPPAPTGGTNAKRFAAGLPPLAPRHYHNLPHRHRRDNKNAYGNNNDDQGNDDDDDGHGPHKPKPSNHPPVTVKCNILVKGTNGTTFGWLSPTWNVFGEYGQLQQSQTGALEISFSYVPRGNQVVSQILALADNGPSPAYPFFGMTVGYSSPSNDLVKGNYNYLYVTGTTNIPPGPPVFADNNSFGGTTGIPKYAEAAVWTYNPKTGDFAPQWVNTNGSLPATFITWANDFNQAFLVTGDVAFMQAIFGAPYPPVTFTCLTPRGVYGS